MSKTIRKLRPSDYWRIGEHESWFQDMAAQGFHLKKMGLRFAHFTKGEPKKTKYRIEVAMKKKLSPEQLEIYEDSGWDYVTGYQYFQVFSSPAEQNAPELHTDPAEQAFTMHALGKKLVFNAVIVAASLLLMFGMLSAVWFLDGTPTYILVEGLALQQTVLAVLFIYLSVISLQAALSIHALRKDLMEGKSINHHAPWKKRYRMNSIITFAFILVAGLSAIIPFVQLTKSETNTLPEATPDLPIVRLADIEQNDALDFDQSSYMIDGVDWANRYSFQWSPIAPVQYETDENGDVPGEMWNDGSGEYSPSIRTKVYQLRMPSLADQLIADLIKRTNYEYSLEDYIETAHAGFDHLLVHEDEELKEVFAAKGKAVMYVRYFGYADMDSVIQNTAEKITLID